MTAPAFADHCRDSDLTELTLTQSSKSTFVKRQRNPWCYDPTFLLKLEQQRLEFGRWITLREIIKNKKQEEKKKKHTSRRRDEPKLVNSSSSRSLVIIAAGVAAILEVWNTKDHQVKKLITTNLKKKLNCCFFIFVSYWHICFICFERVLPDAFFISFFIVPCCLYLGNKVSGSRTPCGIVPSSE